MTRICLSPLYILFCLFATILSQRVLAQDFDKYFADSTLRIDYIFAGDATGTKVIAEGLSTFAGWAGRRHHLARLPLQGNGRITMHSLRDGRILYRTSFSSLYQEWLSTEEAARQPQAYENVFLLPMPKERVRIEVELNDMHRKLIATSTQIVDPRDIQIRCLGAEAIYPHRYLLRSGPSDRCIDVAILAEGYTAAEMPAFYLAAERTVAALLAHQPFGAMRERFNIVAVGVPSAHSGVSVPRKASWLSTAFDSQFDTFYSERYLTTRHAKAVHNALVGIPYEHIIILANTDIYGGGGIYNAFTLTTTAHRQFEQVVVHEFGHSFGGLADEYAYEQDVMTEAYSRTLEPWEQNVTNLVDFAGNKWSNLLTKETPIPTPLTVADDYPVGCYEGAAYSLRGFYRASLGCRMRENKTQDFCPACRQALMQLIDFYTLLE